MNALPQREVEAIVYSIARRYGWATRSGGLDLEDLQQAGRIAADRAQRCWDPEGGSALGNFVFRCAKNAIHKAALEQHATVRLPHTEVRRRRAQGEPTRLSIARPDGSIGAWDALLDSGDAAADADPRIEEAMARLPKMQANVLRMRYFQDLQQDEIGAAIGLHRSRAAQIEHAALKRMRQILQPEGGDCRESSE